MQSSFGVYLHDTPGKAAFARAERTLSHGCMRVEQIHALAALALSGFQLLEGTDLESAIKGGETKTLPLPFPIAVYGVYWTAIPDWEGSVSFRPDVYRRDAALLAALAARSHERSGSR
jgi:murein L,D-transpeptidase YcbB/YkuD